MVFVACGLNHKTAPLELREKVSVSADKQADFLQELMDLNFVEEAMILSTCNRTEIYCETVSPVALSEWFAIKYQLPREDLDRFFYLYQEDAGFKHVLRVAAGLDSMMLGEPQILGQMKEAYQKACDAGTVRSALRSLFECLFSAAKKVRNQSGIAKNPVSIAYACVQLVSQCFRDLQAIRIFLIGSGETASLVARYLKKAGASVFVVASRCPENADKLATLFQGKTVSISEIPKQLVETDVLITATSCPLPFIDEAMVKEVMQQRKGAPLFLLDLAMPRDIDARVGLLEAVTLYNLDDLKNSIDRGLAQRQLAAIEAEEIVNSELEKYQQRHRALAARELICSYRAEMQKLGRYELKKALNKLEMGMNQELVMEELCTKLINKLTHLPLIGLKKMALDDRLDLLEFSRALFNRKTKEKNHEEIA